MQLILTWKTTRRTERSFSCAPPGTVCFLFQLPLHTGEWRQQDEERRTNRDKRIRPQPCSPLPPLAFGADYRAEHQRASQTYHELEPRKMRTDHMRGECARLKRQLGVTLQFFVPRKRVARFSRVHRLFCNHACSLRSGLQRHRRFHLLAGVSDYFLKDRPSLTANGRAQRQLCRADHPRASEILTGTCRL